MTELDNIVKKYGSNKWLFGQFIPVEAERKYKIMFIGEKPSEYFKKYPNKRYLGNYNVTNKDKKLKEYIKKYSLGKVYITDMVKTEGKAGADFKKEWEKNKEFKKCLMDEIKKVNPVLFVVMSEKTENLFTSEFPKYKNKIIRIYHPSHVVRYNNYANWDNQFKDISQYLQKAV